MSLPTSLSAYQDCQQYFDLAVSGAKGARLKLATEDQCIQLRTRLHYFRKLDRALNAETYPAGHPSHGQSIYDQYVVQIFPDEDRDTGHHWVYIKRRDASILAAETLDADDVLVQIESAPLDTEGFEVRQLAEATPTNVDDLPKVRRLT